MSVDGRGHAVVISKVEACSTAAQAFSLLNTHDGEKSSMAIFPVLGPGGRGRETQDNEKQNNTLAKGV